MRNLLLLLFSLITLLNSIHAEGASWISTPENGANDENTWIAFRKDISLNKKPSKTIAHIAVDSKYWLWINGEMAIFEGSLKRGPKPNASYYDEVDIAPYLHKGINKIAVLTWHFGKEGFSHKDSGKSGLYFDAPSIGLSSDSSWYALKHPAYQNCGDPKPNYRLPEANIRFNSNFDIPQW